MQLVLQLVWKASGRNCYIGICIILEELLVIDYGQFTAERFQDLLYLP